MSISSNQIPYVNLQAQWEEEKDDLLPIIEKVLRIVKVLFKAIYIYLRIFKDDLRTFKKL